MNLITVQAKKEFIRFFLSQHQLKNRESVWILNYLVSVEGLLDRVHFVDDIGACPISLVMSTFCSENEAFLYFKGTRISINGELAFQDIRQHKFDDLYIQLNFKDKEISQRYKAIREDASPKALLDKVRNEDQELVNSMITHFSATFQKKWLLEKIDDALDRKDEKTFLQLVEKLHSLQK